jgi:hypothetical protein
MYQNKKPLNHYALVILDQYQNKEPHAPSIYNNKKRNKKSLLQASQTW